MNRLNLIPVANFVFAFSNHVAAALWCANIYKEELKQNGQLKAAENAEIPLTNDTTSLEKQPLASANDNTPKPVYH